MTSALAEHLHRLQAWLRSLPEAPNWDAVRMIESASITYGSIATLPRAALCTVEAYEERFETLFAAGYAWINLAALGVEEGTLLVSVELPRDAVGVPRGRTSINFSGPPNDVKTGAPLWHLGTRIRVVE